LKGARTHMVRILAIAASARRGGNSDTVLNAALDGIRTASPDVQVETIVPYDIHVAPCRSCGGCHKTGRCVIKDDMQSLYQRFLDADHIVVASPIYFTSVPGHFKVMVDRFQCFWARMFLLNNPPQPRRTGMFLCVGAMDRKRYFQSALSIVKTWMLVLNVGCSIARFYPRLDASDDIARRPDCVEDARQSGIALVSSAR
jgi:multimeric flavodoxin WrbA